MALQTPLLVSWGGAGKRDQQIDCFLSLSVSGVFCPFLLMFCVSFHHVWCLCMVECMFQCVFLCMCTQYDELWSFANALQRDGSCCNSSVLEQNVSPPQRNNPNPFFLLYPQPIRYSLPFSQAQHCQQNQPVALVTPFSCLLKSISQFAPGWGSNSQIDCVGILSEKGK